MLLIIRHDIRFSYAAPVTYSIQQFRVSPASGSSQLVRHWHGRPETGVHAIQMELACRGYLDEPATPDETNWPTPFDPARAASLAGELRAILTACLDWKATA